MKMIHKLRRRIAMLPPIMAMVVGTSAQAELPANISERLKAAGVDDAAMSLVVEPLGKGELRIRHRDSALMVPASTQKLVTTFAALDTLGADYRWQTRVYQHGAVMGGTLYGDLIIVGAGDPALTHDALTSLFEKVKQRGIKHIHGNIIIDNLAFKGASFDTASFDRQALRAYNAQPNALLVNFGTIEVSVTPKSNTQASITVKPSLANFTAPEQMPMVSATCTKANSPNFDLTTQALSVRGVMSNQCAASQFWLAFADTNALAVKAVQGEWQIIDPIFTGQVIIAQQAWDIKAQGGAHLPIVTWYSKSLKSLIADINLYSNNVMTEQMALSLPLTQGAKQSDYPQAFAFLTSWWKSKLSTTPPEMTRASGLCRDCKVSASAMVSLLNFAYHSPNFEPFLVSLPVVGQTGTMAEFAKRQPQSLAIGRAWMKTGTLDGVHTIAGFAKDANDEWYAVSAMINAPSSQMTYDVILALDEVLNGIANYPNQSITHKESP